MDSQPGLDLGQAKHARRAVIAATIGTMIEWYDFYLYGLVAALVFGKLYFPSHDPFAATLLSFSTFFLGFVARPFGAAIFGHFGDRIGRKATLVVTLMLMGVSTVLIGLVPTYDSIGIWGAVALTVLRIMQGVGVGGEWGGAIAVATEWGQFNKRRGLAGSWPQFGSPLGMLLAVLVLTIVTHAGSAEWFETIGWRIPFLLSAVLIGVGLYIRLGVLETPVFQEMKAKKQVAKAPVLDAVRLYWKEILLTCLIRTGQQAPFVLFTTYLLSYGTSVLKLDRSFLFNCVLAAAATSLITTPLFGYLSDRIGRKRMYLIGAFTMLVFAFPYYWLINSAIPAVIVLTVIVSLVVHDMQYGPQAAFIAESFPPNVRYSGASIGYQLASLTSGGPAPIIATWLMHTYGTSTAISCYLAIIAAISLISAALLKDRSKEDYVSVALRAPEPDAEAALPLVAPRAKPTLS
ncbi:MFS transporter [Methylobacterium sp. NEAU K]|uniref:MFS transporter n=1 Tax=Methylobacterium sp. NEAU K TaxID=3064946 RepID=UPI0027322EA0|nr:MFS transporter [Methylobacterium sp. NEAU K]MDP4006952.1 MFS transporter [Methylobacterium sp. NEAU K]